jgi:hypothetical protein
MAAETTTTSLTKIINSEVIDQMIADYLIDAEVISPLCTFRSIAGAATKVCTFTRWDKDSGSDITDGTGLSSNTAMAMSENSVTVGVVGIAREITDFAAETNKIGPAGIYNRVLQDGAALAMEMREDDLAALFISATGTTIGTSGVDLSVANFVEAIARLRTAKSRGKYVCVLDDQQSYDLSAAVAAATGTVWANSSAVQNTVLNSRSDGYVGNLLGVDIWYTNLTDTTNTSADVVGSMWVDPESNDEQCAYAWVQLWAPRVRERVDPYQPSVEMSVTHAYGVGVKYAAAAVPIVTDA